MVFRGSIARRLIWLSTLRRGGRPPTTQDSLPAAGPALPDGIGYPQGSLRKVSSLRLSSFPELSCARPVTRRGVGIEEPDAAASDDQRGRGELAVVLEVQQIVADLLLGEPVRWGVEVVGQLPDGAEIGLLSTLAQTGELEVLEHPLMEWRGHVLVLAQRVKKQPLRGTLGHGPGCCQGGGSQREFR